MKRTDRDSVAVPEGLLRNRVAVITGGSRGIGRATALRMAEAGAHILINYLDDEIAAKEVAERARRFGVDVATVQADVANAREAMQLARFAVKRFARIDILVANAGIWEGAAVENMTESVWDRVINTNLRGTWTVCRAVTPIMRRGGAGAIVIVSSTAGQRGEAGYSNYAASKGGQISFAKSLAVELAPKIRVNCVAPGWVDTDLNVPVFRDSAFASETIKTIPLRRLARADDVATAILFLASDWARHITGEVLNVNGGAVLCG